MLKNISPGLVLFVSLLGTLPAFAGSFTSQIKPEVGLGTNSGADTCIDVIGQATTIKTGVDEWSCVVAGQANQSFTFVPVSGDPGFYVIHPNNYPSGESADALCIALPAGTMTNGAHVEQYTCMGTPDQEFSLVPNGSSYVLQDKKQDSSGNNYCLDMTSGATADGTLLQIWECSSGPNQQFQIPNAATSAPPPKGIASTIKNDNSQNCLVGGSGAPTTDAACSSASNQQFELVAVSGGYYEIMNQAENLCLGASGGSNASGALIEEESCNGSASQEFKPVAMSGLPGYDELVVSSTQYCLRIAAAGSTISPTAGVTLLDQEPCNGTYGSEAFVLSGLAPAPAPSPSPSPSPLAGGTSGCGEANPSGSPATVVIQNNSSPVPALTSAIAGLSYEKSQIYGGLFNGNNTGLAALFKRLGPDVLRLGGNSTDSTTWNATGAGGQSGIVAPSDIDRLSTFMGMTGGWKIIYGINFKTNTPASAAAEAAYVAKAFGSNLLGFEIGNEPDLYSGGTLSSFVTKWNSLESAIKASVPSAAFTGPAPSWDTQGYAIPFAEQEGHDGGRNVLSMVTQHYYRGAGGDSGFTIAELLAPDTVLIDQKLIPLQSAASSNKLSLGYRLAEANSLWGGGTVGVSDSFASALWAIDFLFNNAQYGAAGVNFHGGGDGASSSYTPIADNGSSVVMVRPVYYGMYVFSMASNGTLNQTSVSANGNPLTAYAVTASGGKVSVVLNNKDSSSAFSTTITFMNPINSATSLVLTAPSVSSTTGYTLGGSTIGTNGAFTAASNPSVPVCHNQAKVSVPAGSAMIIQAQ